MSDKPTRRQFNEIGAIPDSMVLWERGEGLKRFEEYQKQRFWIKIETAKLVPLNKEYYEIVVIET